MDRPSQIFSDLVRVETALWNAVDARLREECDLTLARFEVMRVIEGSGPCRVLDIAAELAIGWSGASKIVDRVAAAGHARRRPNPKDARSSLITLTSNGRSIARAASAVVDNELHSALVGSLAADELEALAKALAKLRER